MAATDTIRELFLSNESLTFAQLQHASGLRSNLVAYALVQLQRKGVLVKAGERYKLSDRAEQDIPYVSTVRSPLPVVMVRCIRENGDCILLERTKRPYKGLYAMPGGRMQLGENFSVAATRILKAKTFLDCTVLGVRAVCNERVLNANAAMHGFVLIVIDAVATSEIREKPGIAWRSPQAKRTSIIVPSDEFFLSASPGIYECVLLPRQDGNFDAIIESVSTSAHTVLR